MGWLDSALSANGIGLQEAAMSALSDPDTASDVLNNPRAYRSLGKSNLRDLPPLDQERMIEIAIWLYDANPLAKNLIEMRNDFIVGEGFTFSAGHDEVQAVLEAFWDDPVNAWELKQFQRFRQLSLMGELCLPVFVRRKDGRVRLGYVDPSNISRVEVDPYNAEIRTGVVLKAIPGQSEATTLPIIHVDEAANSPSQGLLIGAPAFPDDAGPYGTFYVPINNLSNSARGRSDLLTAFDWLDVYDQFLFAQAERSAAFSDELWDVTMDDTTLAQQRDWLRQNSMPKGRSMRVHNQHVKWENITPDFNAADVSEQGRTFRQQIVMGAGGFPEHWLFSAKDANRSTADAQHMPILKRLSKHQKEAKAIVRHILEFVRDQAILAGRLPKSLTPEQRAIKVQGSEVDTKDAQVVAETLKALAESLVVAEDRHWVTREESASLYRRTATELGAELAQELPERAEGEDDDTDEPDELREARRWYPRVPRRLARNGHGRSDG